MSAIDRESLGLMRWQGYSFIKYRSYYMIFGGKWIIESRKNGRIMEQSPWVGIVVDDSYKL